jgi:cytochrome c oxidase subunit 2
MIGRQFEWWPILELEEGKQYRLHLASTDVQHGFSLQPVNINLQVHPGYEMVLTVTPNSTGEFPIVCNEYCGLGHHLMVGRVNVVEAQ